MNRVFIAGIVVGQPAFRDREKRHLIFRICLCHRAAKRIVKREIYTVNAWHSTATWGARNLKQGQYIAIEGYLTQRHLENGETLVEITAVEFVSNM